jgi:glycosyltransferase involved in cell wall biosynthesis
MPRVSGALTALFVVNTDAFFLSHRLPLALALRDRGFEVWIASNDTGSRDIIESQGLGFSEIRFAGGAIRPGSELAALARLLRLYWKLRPRLIHHVTVRPVLYGSLAARILPKTAVVNAVSGLGFTFSEGTRARRIRRFALPLYRAALNRPRSVTICQNPDDLAELRKYGLLRGSEVAIIRGSGVDVDRFRPALQKKGAPVVMMASRLLWDKGVGEFVEAALVLRSRYPNVRFVLVGDPDLGNPHTIPQDRIAQWVGDGAVEWWGHRADMERVLQEATIVVLPSYREGLPKVLLEAASCGNPLVATDVPGCREIVRHGSNGLLVPPRDSGALSKAIARLLDEPGTRMRMGHAGRALVESQFSLDRVVKETMAVYERALQDGDLRL